MLAAESPVTTTGIWGVVGVVAAGLLALLTDWVRKRYGWGTKKDSDEPSEKIAADTASRELLIWIEDHTLKPMRRDLIRMTERADKLQSLIDARQLELAEARAIISELRTQIVFMEQQLAARLAQIGVLLEQLGDRHDGPKRPRQRPDDDDTGLAGGSGRRRPAS